LGRWAADPPEPPGSPRSNRTDRTVCEAGQPGRVVSNVAGSWSRLLGSSSRSTVIDHRYGCGHRSRWPRSLLEQTVCD
jgi:hypothetical protein